MKSADARARRDTVGDTIRRSARRSPSKVAISFPDRRWTYSELDRAANRLGNALLARGFVKGDRIAAYAMNSDLYLLLRLGCAKAGLSASPSASPSRMTDSSTF